MFLFPALLILGLFMVYPIIDAFLISFCNYNPFIKRDFIGLKNYGEIFQDKIFWKALVNTLIYLLVTPLITVLSLGLAILVNKQIRGINFFRMMFYLPVVTSMVVVAIAWKWLYSDSGGLLNELLSMVNLPGINWLTDTRTSLPSVMWVTIWKGLGYYMVIFLAGLQGIPKSLMEAAEVDGAGRFRKLMNVTVPCLRPYIVLVMVISFIEAWKVFDEVYLLTKGGPLHSSETLGYYIYHQAFINNFNMGYASAMGVVLFIIILVFSLLNIRYVQRDSAS